MHCKLGKRSACGAVAWGFIGLLCGALLGTGPALASKRVALVIGNSAYGQLAPLHNPHHDARAVADLLKSHGWEVVEGANLSFVQLHDALTDFEAKAQGAEVALAYYAGHGMSFHGRDFVAPTDMPEACGSDALKRGIPLEHFFKAVEGAQRKIVLLDACRNQPFPNCAKRGSDAGFRGLARIQSSGLLIVSSTAAGAVAEDGAPGAHSPFARVLLDRFRTYPNAYMHEVLVKVAGQVEAVSRQRQTPEYLLKGRPPEACLSAEPCGPLTGAPADVEKMRREAEELTRRSKEEAERRRRQAAQEADAAERRRREEEAKIEAIRREAETIERRRRDDEARAEAIRRQAEEDERRRRERETAMRAIPPPTSAPCGWYAIAYCAQDMGSAQAQSGRFNGFVINTSHYPRFRAGWFCVVQGPMARDGADAAVRRMKAQGAGTAYSKNSC
jgi:hypothetical protein